MNKLGQISIALFVINNTVFDLISKQSTHLSIMYFSIMYFCFMLFAINEHLRFNKGWKALNLENMSFSLVMGFGFAVRMILELTKWRLTWDEYLVSVSSYDKSLLFSFLMIALILIPITNDRKIRNNRNDG